MKKLIGYFFYKYDRSRGLNMPNNKKPPSWASVVNNKKNPAAQATKPQKLTKKEKEEKEGEKEQNITTDPLKTIALAKNPMNDLPVAAIQHEETQPPPISTSPTPPEVESKTELSPIDAFLADAKDKISTANDASILLALREKAAASNLLKNQNDAENIYFLLIESAITKFRNKKTNVAYCLSNMAAEDKVVSKTFCKKMIQLFSTNDHPRGMTYYFWQMKMNNILNDQDILFVMNAYEICNPTDDEEKIDSIDNAWILYAEYLSPENKSQSDKSHLLIMKMVHKNADITQAYLLNYALRAYENLIHTHPVNNEENVKLMFDIASHYYYTDQEFLDSFYREELETRDLDKIYLSSCQRHIQMLQENLVEFSKRRALQVENMNQHKEIQRTVHNSWRPDSSLTPTKTTAEITAEQKKTSNQTHSQFVPAPVVQQYNLSPFVANSRYGSMFQQVHSTHQQGALSYQPPTYYRPTQSKRW